ncbi:MAG: Type 1 glutamine amidotransferase-like domain-containing protein [Bacteroidota bacterium]
MLGQGSVLVIGGGSPPSDAAQWMADRASRILVLDYTNDADTPWPNRFRDAGAEANYLVVSATDAQRTELADLVRTYDGVFLPGGDQNRYVTQWTGTVVAGAIRDVFEAGGVIGGTSAGAMVLGSVVYDARTGGVSAGAALRDPSSLDVALSSGFLSVVPDAVIDTHLSERGRWVRVLAFVARAIQDGFEGVDGIGVDDGTALAISPDGTAEVIGNGVVAFVRPSEDTAVQVASGMPLGLGPVQFVQIATGQRVDLETLDRLGDAGDPYAASELALPGGAVVVGDASSSVHAFVSQVPSDPVVVLTGASTSQASGLIAQIEAEGRRTSVWNAAEVSASTLVSANGLALVGLDRLATTRLLSDAAIRSAMQSAVMSGTPLLAADTTARLLGVNRLIGLSDSDGSYRGRLELESGLGVLGGIVLLEETYGADRDVWENESAGWMWSVMQSGAGLGLMVPQGASLRLQDNHVVASGTAPVIILDVRETPSVGFPPVRQNAELVNAVVHVMAPGDSVALARETSQVPNPSERGSLRVRPNPAQDRAVLDMMLQHAQPLHIVVLDSLGRDVQVVHSGILDAGTHQLEVPVGALPAGLYSLWSPSWGHAERFTVVR